MCTDGCPAVLCCQHHSVLPQRVSVQQPGRILTLQERRGAGEALMKHIDPLHQIQDDSWMTIEMFLSSNRLTDEAVQLCSRDNARKWSCFILMRFFTYCHFIWIRSRCVFSSDRQNTAERLQRCRVWFVSSDCNYNAIKASPHCLQRPTTEGLWTGMQNVCIRWFSPGCEE